MSATVRPNRFYDMTDEARRRWLLGRLEAERASACAQGYWDRARLLLEQFEEVERGDHAPSAFLCARVSRLRSLA